MRLGEMLVRDGRLTEPQLSSALQAQARDGTADLADYLPPADHPLYHSVARELIRVERKTAVRLRNEGRLNNEALRRIEHELDLNELRLSATA